MAWTSRETPSNHLDSRTRWRWCVIQCILVIFDGFEINLYSLYECCKCLQKLTGELFYCTRYRRSATVLRTFVITFIFPNCKPPPQSDNLISDDSTPGCTVACFRASTSQYDVNWKLCVVTQILIWMATRRVKTLRQGWNWENVRPEFVAPKTEGWKSGKAGIEA